MIAIENSRAENKNQKKLPDSQVDRTAIIGAKDKYEDKGEEELSEVTTAVLHTVFVTIFYHFLHTPLYLRLNALGQGRNFLS